MTAYYLLFSCINRLVNCLVLFAMAGPSVGTLYDISGFSFSRLSDGDRAMVGHYHGLNTLIVLTYFQVLLQSCASIATITC